MKCSLMPNSSILPKKGIIKGIRFQTALVAGFKIPEKRILTTKIRYFRVQVTLLTRGSAGPVKTRELGKPRIRRVNNSSKGAPIQIFSSAKSGFYPFVYLYFILHSFYIFLVKKFSIVACFKHSLCFFSTISLNGFFDRFEMISLEFFLF